MKIKVLRKREFLQYSIKCGIFGQFCTSMQLVAQMFQILCFQGLNCEKFSLKIMFFDKERCKPGKNLEMIQINQIVNQKTPRTIKNIFLIFHVSVIRNHYSEII